MVDLSIPASRLVDEGADPATLVPGLGEGRTTRLHYWQGNVTQSANGTFVASSPALAPYSGPMPPAGDGLHAYTFYLFAQPADYSVPAEAAAGTFQNISSSSRMNFSVTAQEADLGMPLAANYIRTETPAANATATNGTAGAANPTVAPFTGAAAKVGAGAGVVLAGVGMLAFSML